MPRRAAAPLTPDAITSQVFADRQRAIVEGFKRSPSYHKAPPDRRSTSPYGLGSATTGPGHRDCP